MSTAAYTPRHTRAYMARHAAPRHHRLPLLFLAAAVIALATFLLAPSTFAAPPRHIAPAVPVLAPQARSAHQPPAAAQVAPVSAVLDRITFNPEPRGALARKAIGWAITQAGAWYAWGGTGPYSAGYDCSGLVWRAYKRAGVTLPRTTYGMLASWHLVRTYAPHRGDLAFYGTGHVEFVTRRTGRTFGALETGTRIGWHTYGGSWYPTMYFRVRR